MSSAEEQNRRERERQEREREEHPPPSSSSGQAPRAVSIGATAAAASSQALSQYDPDEKGELEFRIPDYIEVMPSKLEHYPPKQATK